MLPQQKYFFGISQTSIMNLLIPPQYFHNKHASLVFLRQERLAATSEPLHCFFYLAPSLQSHVAHPLAFKYLLKCQLLNHIYPDQYIYNRSLGGPIVVQWK